jgi:HEAT repeat protein
MLEDPDPAARRQAIETLTAIYATNQIVVARFSDALKDPSDEVRRAAAKGMAQFGLSDSGAVPGPSPKP